MALKCLKKKERMGKTIKRFAYRNASQAKEKNSGRPTEGSFHVISSDMPSSDGSITLSNIKLNQNVEYSLGKRNRWLLQSYFKETSETFFQSPSQLILSERLMLFNTSMRKDNCISYFDSMFPDIEIDKNGSAHRPQMFNLPSYQHRSEPWWETEYSNRARRRRRAGKKKRKQKDPQPLPEKPNDHQVTKVEFSHPISAKSTLYYAAASYLPESRIRLRRQQPDKTVVRAKFHKRRNLITEISQDLNEEQTMNVDQDNYNDIYPCEIPPLPQEDNISRPTNQYSLETFLITKSKQSKKRRTVPRHDSFTEPQRKRKVIYEYSDEANPPHNESPIISSSEPESVIDLTCRPLPETVCSVAETPCREELEEQFGNKYFEGESFPTKFMIDISGRLSLSSPSVLVVFEESGRESESEQFYKIKLNSIRCTELENEFCGMVIKNNSIKEIVDEISQFANSFELDGVTSRPINTISCSLQYDDNLIPSYRPTSHTNTLHNIFLLHSEWNNQPESLPHTRHIPPATERIICQVCFEESDSLGGGFTSLLQCGHSFCNECWLYHLLMAVRTGKTKIKCLQHECGCVVDLVTILTFLPLDVYRTRFATLENEVLTSKRIESSILCSNCGHLILIDSAQKVKHFSVQCQCGNSICAVCKAEPHWPASCNNTRLFTKKLKDLGDDKLTPPSALTSCITVKGKKCPKCVHFIEKNGGCNHISCLCGFQFCWCCEELWAPKHYSCSIRKESKEFVFEGNNVPLPGSLRSRIYCRCIAARLESHDVSLRKVWKGLKRLEDNVVGNFKMNVRADRVKQIRQNYELIMKTREFLLVESLNSSVDMRVHLRYSINALQLNISLINENVFESKGKLTDGECLSKIEDIFKSIEYSRIHIRTLVSSLHRVV